MRLTRKLEPPYERVIGKDYVYTSDTRLTSSFAGVEQKLGRLEDLEEELGIDLLTLFNVLKNGMYAKLGNEIIYIHNPVLNLDTKTIGYLYKYGLKDYGETWALTKEELRLLREK